MEVPVKKGFAVFAVILTLLFTGNLSHAETIPDNIKEYAEKSGLNSFIYLAPSMQFPDAENIDFSKLRIGEGYREHIIKELNETLSDSLEPSYNWLFTVCQENGDGLSFIEVHTEGDLNLGFGGDSSYFVKAMAKMKELIQSYGDDAEPTVIWYGTEHLLYYSFGGDERVMEIDSYDFEQNYLSVSDYTQLPTGREVIAQLEKNREFWSRPENSDAVGGAHLGLALHESSLTDNTKSPMILYIISLLVFLTGGAFIVFFCTRRKIKRVEHNH